MLKSPSAQASPLPLLTPGEVVARRYRIDRCLEPLSEPATGEWPHSSAHQPTPDGPFVSYLATDLAASQAPGQASSPAPASRSVLLKVLRPSPQVVASVALKSLLGAEALSQWQQQAQLIPKLRHPGIVPAYAMVVGDEHGGALLCREAAETQSQSLRALLAARSGPFPESEALQLVAQVGLALETAHQAGVLHLCLSPARIWVTEEDGTRQLRIADFGLLPPSLAFHYADAGYLAPEQHELNSSVAPSRSLSPAADPGRPTPSLPGEPGLGTQPPLSYQRCDPRTDQFALAVILYELLAGQPAFIGAANEPRAVILHRAQNEDPLPLSLSRRVEQALARALSRSRAVRFPSIRDFMRALGVDVSSWPSPLLPAAAAPPPRRQLTRIVVPMAMGAALSLLGLFLVLLMRHHLTQPLPKKPLPGAGLTSVDAAALTDLGQAPSAAEDAAGSDAASPAVVDLGPRAPGPSDMGPVKVAELGSSVAKVPVVVPPPDGKQPLRPLPPKPLPPQPTASPEPVTISVAVASETPPVALSPEQVSQVKACVRMVRPAPPFRAVLQNVSGVLLPVVDQTSLSLGTSDDFRDCLKFQVKGTIVPKVITVTSGGASKGKPVP